MPPVRILIVEDERQTVDALRDLFEQNGYETEVALNKQVALAILQERKMDLAIISTKVQEISGLEILYEIKKIIPNIPIIVVSDQKSKRIESSFMKAGANVFLAKPLESLFVLQTIENLLIARFAIATPKKTKSYSKSKK
ncbi:MAG: response regulator [Candidatus Brocadia sp. AMX2]|uniref:Sigma-54 dependent DNA-binding response regulator n=1 Tax=Candidatus Brocadia sinica JPN1 TaxID=1197129 RepID=A0ABQ0K0I9_9BACT|nr:MULTISPECIES: response regulator [Brocadia]KXK31444.1 MAG: putative transcriptional regulator [Candidatus Brocadia sinica]MBC6933885.1 response regulator [Candidatus Brocadia sp.]MBL1170599.1 response regulator [Candidatus Brocadia sp. AMX1]NOG42334.1 response regulator [Planctomycetota bacterium]KAA0242300.1 MAG: response regulator [Candidatus Brocadia sp. AMX2]